MINDFSVKYLDWYCSEGRHHDVELSNQFI